MRIIRFVLAAGALPYTPLGHAFGFAAPGLPFLVAVGAILVGYVGTTELTKRLFYRHRS